MFLPVQWELLHQPLEVQILITAVHVRKRVEGPQWASAHPVVCSLNPYSRDVESTLCLHPAAECEVLLCIVLRTFLERLS